MAGRSERERDAYDHGEVLEVSAAYHEMSMVLRYPNTLFHEALYEEVLRAKAHGGRVLDVGCANGRFTQKIFHMGARSVLGIDISERFIRDARRLRVPGRLEFRLKDVMAPMRGRYDLITGRAVLHHIEFRKALKKLYSDNLAEGGRMVFMEPLADNLLMAMFYFVVRSAHTPDEKPFSSEDLAWIRDSFANVRFVPFNFFSLFFGIPLALMCNDVASNPIMCAADVLDRWIARRVPLALSHFRQVIIIIDKPAREVPHNR